MKNEFILVIGIFFASFLLFGIISMIFKTDQPMQDFLLCLIAISLIANKMKIDNIK